MLIAASVLLPVLFTVAIGFWVERWRTMDARTLSTVSIYVLTPCLVFYSLLTTHLTHQDILQIVSFLPGLTLTLWVITKLVLRIRREPASEEGPTMLGVLFMNAGNYGIPMCKSAFGPAGVEHGVVWVVVQNTVLFPLATYYAARDRHGSRDAFLAVFKLPSIWAMAAAIVLRSAHVTLSAEALEPVRSIGYAMIPVAQILLGIQLGKTVKATRFAEIDRIGWICLLRLVAAPLIALPLTSALGAHGLTRRVLILLAGTPTAVNMTVLALEFDSRPEYIASVVFFTTIASFATLSVTLSLLHLAR